MCHRRRNSQRLVNPTEVVERVPQRNSVPVVLPLLAEGIRKAREAAIAHPRAKVVALHNRGTDAVWIRLAHHWDNLR